MKLQTSCSLTFEITTPSPFILMLRPRSGAHQWVTREEYSLLPQVPVREFTDTFGNLCQRIVAPAGAFELHSDAEVFISGTMDRAPGAPFVEIQELPDDVLQYLLPSRYCEAELFCQLAGEITTGQTLGYDQVSAIETWIRSNFSYDFSSSDSSVSATEVNARKSGVCRDFAHLGIALCRSISIPARMVVGYLYKLEPMDLHAWFEAFVGGRWYAFDATQNTLRNGYVVLGIGRDAADVAVYNQFGPPLIPLKQHVQVKLIEKY